MRRILDKRRKPKAPKKTRTEVYLTNLKFLGEEPTFEKDKPLTDADVAKAYNWYNYMSDQNELMEFAMEWAGANDEDLKGSIERIPPKLFPSTAGKLLRLSSLGYDIGQKRIDFAKKLITEQSVKENTVEEEPIADASTPSEVMVKKGGARDKYDSYVGQFEIIIDKCDWELNVYDSLRGNNFPVSAVSSLKGYYQPLLEEYETVLSGTDPDLNEGYRNYKKSEIRKTAEFLKKAIEDFTRYGQVVRKQSSPRKKKPQSLEKKLATFTYKKNSVEFKLESIPPENAVGASEALLFNTKYRTLVLLKALEGGLDIKGKSFKNVDDKTSLQTGTGRRTDRSITEVMAGGRATMNDWMKKKCEPGRPVKVSSDDNTMILRVFK